MAAFSCTAAMGSRNMLAREVFALLRGQIFLTSENGLPRINHWGLGHIRNKFIDEHVTCGKASAGWKRTCLSLIQEDVPFGSG